MIQSESRRKSEGGGPRLPPWSIRSRPPVHPDDTVGGHFADELFIQVMLVNVFIEADQQGVAFANRRGPQVAGRVEEPRLERGVVRWGFGHVKRDHFLAFGRHDLSRGPRQGQGRLRVLFLGVGVLKVVYLDPVLLKKLLSLS